MARAKIPDHLGTSRRRRRSRFNPACPLSQLVADCVANVPGAFENLLASINRTLMAAAKRAIRSTRVLPGTVSAEDLRQDFVLALLKKEPTKLRRYCISRSWLFTAMRRFCVKKLKSHQYAHPPGTEHLHSDEPAASRDRSVDMIDDLECVTKMLEHIDVPTRSIIQSFLGLVPSQPAQTVPEIADRLGCGIRTIYRRLQRAAQWLREIDVRSKMNDDGAL